MKNVPIKFLDRPRATIGLIQVPSDIVLDMEAGPLLGQVADIIWRFTKMKFADHDSEINEETYKRASKNISEATRTFLPAEAGEYGTIDVMVLSCTSLSFTLGPEMVQKELLSGYPSATAVTDMATAVVAAIKSVTQKSSPRVALLTPYIREVHQSNLNFLLAHEIHVAIDHNLGFKCDKETSALSPTSIFNFARALADGDETIDAIFIGCSAFRSTQYGFIDKLEQETGKPVITSNQAVLWQSLTLCEKIHVKDISAIVGYGRLFTQSSLK